MLLSMDVACGRAADELRARSLAFALTDLPLRWLAAGARRVALSRSSSDFPATAAEVYREAWKAAGFEHVYNPRLEGDAAYRYPRIGEVRWWPVAELAGEWKRLATNWAASPRALALPDGGYLLPPGEAMVDEFELPALPAGAGLTRMLPAEASMAAPVTEPRKKAPPRAPRSYGSGADFLREWNAEPKS